MQGNSWAAAGRLLRVAVLFNTAVKRDLRGYAARPLTSALDFLDHRHFQQITIYMKSYQKGFSITALLLATTVTGCSSAPTGKLDRAEAIAQSIKRENVLVSAHSLLYPDTFEITVSSITTGKPPKAGEIILSDNHLTFLRWREDAKLYAPVYEIELNQINKIKSDTYFSLPYISIQTTNYQFYSFVVYENKHQEFLQTLTQRSKNVPLPR